MKRRVEASHLWHIGHPFQHYLDWPQVVRLVQRRQGNEFLQVGENLSIYQHGTRVLHSTMDDAMTDASQSNLSAQAEQIGSQMFQRSLVVQSDSFAPGFLGNDLSAGISGGKPRGGKQ